MNTGYSKEDDNYMECILLVNDKGNTVIRYSLMNHGILMDCPYNIGDTVDINELGITIRKEMEDELGYEM